MDTRGYIHRNKTNGFRDLGELDIRALRARVEALSESYWREHDAAKPNRFDTLDHTAHIVMKFVRRVAFPTEYREFSAWSEWREDVGPLLQEIAMRCGYARAEFPRVMLARLPAGREISAHVDGGRFPAFCHKIHVPLLCNAETQFYVDPEWRHLAEGNAVEINNNAMHAVRNAGSTDRVHLIFEMFESPLQLRAHTYAGERAA